MQRRTFISGALLLSGGLSGHILTRLIGSCADNAISAQTFTNAIEGINLEKASSALLLKLLTRQLTKQDSHTFIAEVASHNRTLFIADANIKRHGIPGFYRVDD